MNAINYELKDLKPGEAQFIMEAISSVPAPLNLSGPIYSKIKDQIDAQNAAFLAAQEKNKEVVPANTPAKSKTRK